MNVEDELKEAGVKPVKGQNFLGSEPVIQALVEAGEVDGETVLEIGAGTGAITEKLLERAEKVVALETDTTLTGRLEQKFSGVEVLNQGFLEYSIPEEVTRCVSNIPFQISSEVVEKLGREQLQSALIVQEELADKLVAEPGESSYGFSTVRTQYFFVPVKLRTVPSSSFYPEPDVDAAILKLYPNKGRWNVEDEEAFFKLAKALFTHKRKKTRNAFVDARHMLDLEKEEAKEMRDELSYSEKRVIELGIKELDDMAEFLF